MTTITEAFELPRPEEIRRVLRPKNFKRELGIR